jgi:hypothetical protein
MIMPKCATHTTIEIITILGIGEDTVIREDATVHYVLAYINTILVRPLPVVIVAARKDGLTLLSRVQGGNARSCGALRLAEALIVCAAGLLALGFGGVERGHNGAAFFGEDAPHAMVIARAILRVTNQGCFIKTVTRKAISTRVNGCVFLFVLGCDGAWKHVKDYVH